MATTVAFFGHNSAEPAIHRRARAFESAGCRVIGFMMRRGPFDAPTPWENVHLGETYDNAYLQRMRAIFKGVRVACREADKLRRADLIYARNLDMLLCASLVKRKLSLDRPIVYECLDVHRLLTQEDVVGRTLRGLERRLLSDCALLVCSSPGFVREYFAKQHPGSFRPFLLENRLPEGEALPARRSVSHPPLDHDRPLRVGWFGNLRCARSFALMERLATTFGNRIVVKMRGYPAANVFPNFAADVARVKPFEYGGKYRAPQDLAEIYGDVDVVWAGDYHEAGANSVWLLPNRIYEGGYFGTPPIAPLMTETGRWIREKNVGFTVEDPVEQSLTALVGQLISDRSAILQYRENLWALPREVFVEPPDFIRGMVETVLRDAHASDAQTALAGAS